MTNISSKQSPPKALAAGRSSRVFPVCLGLVLCLFSAGLWAQGYGEGSDHWLLTQGAAEGTQPHVAVDYLQNSHVVWKDGTIIRYAKVSPQGQPLAKVGSSFVPHLEVHKLDTVMMNPRVAVASDGAAHIAASAGNVLFYARVNPDGSMDFTRHVKIIATTYSSFEYIGADIAIDPKTDLPVLGTLLVRGRNVTVGPVGYIAYKESVTLLRLSADAQITKTIYLEGSAEHVGYNAGVFSSPRIAVGNDGVIHAVWKARETNSSEHQGAEESPSPGKTYNKAKIENYHLGSVYGIGWKPGDLMLHYSNSTKASVNPLATDPDIILQRVPLRINRPGDIQAGTYRPLPAIVVDEDQWAHVVWCGLAKQGEGTQNRVLYSAVDPEGYGSGYGLNHSKMGTVVRRSRQISSAQAVVRNSNVSAALGEEALHVVWEDARAETGGSRLYQGLIVLGTGHPQAAAERAITSVRPSSAANATIAFRMNKAFDKWVGYAGDTTNPAMDHFDPAEPDTTVNVYDKTIEVTATFKPWPSGKACPSDPSITLPGEGSGITFQEVAISADDGVGGYTVVWQEGLEGASEIAFQHNDFWFGVYGLRNTFQAVSGAWSAADRKASLSDANRLSGERVDEPIVPSNTYRELIKESNLYPVQGMIADGVTPLILRCDLDPGEYYVTVRPSGEYGTGVAADISLNRLHVYNHTWEEFSPITVGGPQVRIPKPEGGGAVRECIFYIQGFDCSDPSVGWPIDPDTTCPAAQIPFEIRLFRVPKNGEGLDTTTDAPYGTLYFAVARPPVFLLPGFNPTSEDWSPKFLEILEKGLGKEFVIPVTFATDAGEISGIGEYYTNIENFNLPHDDLADALKESVGDLVGSQYIKSIKILGDVIDKLNKLNTLSFEKSIYAQSPLLWLQKLASIQLAMKEDDIREKYQWAMTRYDAVGHCQGGVLLRMLCHAESYDGLTSFLQKRNFGRGRFRRVITVGSPHRGSRITSYTSLYKDFIWETMSGGSGTRVSGLDPETAKRFGKVLYGNALMLYAGWAGYLEPKFDAFDGEIVWINRGISVHPKAKFHLVSSVIDHTTARATWAFDGIGLRRTTEFGPGRLFGEVFPPEPTGKRHSDGLVDWRSHFGGVDFTAPENQGMLTHVDEILPGSLFEYAAHVSPIPVKRLLLIYQGLKGSTDTSGPPTLTNVIGLTSECLSGGLSGTVQKLALELLKMLSSATGASISPFGTDHSQVDSTVLATHLRTLLDGTVSGPGGPRFGRFHNYDPDHITGGNGNPEGDMSLQDQKADVKYHVGAGVAFVYESVENFVRAVSPFSLPSREEPQAAANEYWFTLEDSPDYPIGSDIRWSATLVNGLLASSAGVELTVDPSDSRRVRVRVEDWACGYLMLQVSYLDPEGTLVMFEPFQAATIGMTAISDLHFLQSEISLEKQAAFALLLEAKFEDAQWGPFMPEDGEISWASSDETIVTVNGSGLVQAGDKVGSATVTATYGSIVASVDITVEGQGPTVVLREPVSEVELMAGESLVLEAQAQDPDGSVDRLFFFANLHAVGEGTASRDGYTFTWENIPAGQYDIFALAVDDEGLAQRSNATTVSVNQRPPVIDSWSHPVADQWYSGCAYFHAAASDPDGDPVTVQFEYSLDSTDGINGTWAQCWYPLTAPPYAFSWPTLPADAVDASVWLRLYAVDSNGAESASLTRRISVDNSSGYVVFSPHPGEADVALEVQPTLSVSGGIVREDGAPVTLALLQDVVRLQAGLSSVPISISLNAEATQVTVTPTSALDGVTAYTLSLGTGLADAASGEPILPASSTFTTTYGSPAAIAFLQVPERMTAGSPPATPFQVAVLDDQGNVVLNNSTVITIRSQTDRGARFSGTLTTTAVEGVAEFADLSVTAAGVIELSAAATGFSDAAPVAVRVAPGPLGYFVISGLADDVVAGTRYAFSVTAFDVYDNVKTDYEGTPSFRSSDPAAQYPGPYTYYVTDGGVHAYSGGIAFRSLGSQWLQVFSGPNESASVAVMVSNAPPAAPVPVSPVGGVFSGLRPVLTVADFVDADGAGHAGTQWQVGRDASFAEIVWDSAEMEPALSVQVPAGVLDPFRDFCWRARFRDGSGDPASEWSAWSVAAAFRTAHQFPFADDFSTDRGWQGLAPGRWERREALAGGGANGFPDPAEDQSPTADNMLLGYALGGDYEPFLTTQRVVSAPVDCSDAAVVELSFWRWLGVEGDAWAQAGVGVSSDGVTWHEVWSNPATEITDSEWTPVTYDLTPWAAGKPTVYISFVMGPQVQAAPYCGWNIDDVQLAGGQADMAEIILECPQTDIQVGQVFEVKVYVQENVAEAAGFLGGTIDLDYPAAMMNYEGTFRLDWIVQQPFTLLRSGSLTAGKIRSLGGLTTASGHGDGVPVLLAVLRFRATQAGLAEFTAAAGAAGFALSSPVGQIGNWRVAPVAPLQVPIDPFVAEPLAYVTVEGPSAPVAQGNTFEVAVYVREVASNANGFLGGPLDLNFEPERVSCDDFAAETAIQPPFNSLGITSGTVAERRIDELGGATLASGYGNGTKVLYARLTFLAETIGTAVFSASPGSSGLALASPVGQLDFARIHYGVPLSISIEPGHRLTVNHGSDSTGKYNHTVGATVSIVADPAETGTAFDHWEGDVQHLANAAQATTTVTMPAADVTVSAVYRQIDYTLTVNGGSGGTALAHYQDEIAIVANQPAIGQQFDRWTGHTQYLADPTSAATHVMMPAANVAVTATYRNILYTLNVENGSGDTAQATYGQWIWITADEPGESRRFHRWTGDTAGVQNVNAAGTYVRMPADNVTVTAEYKNLYHLTVVKGSGSGKYAEGDTVVITADAPAPDGPPFTQWIGNVDALSDVNQASASLVMPGADVAVVAIYGSGGFGDVRIELSQGWSLISVHKPTLCPAGHPDYAGLIQGPMWVWNGRAYVPVSFGARDTVLLEPNRGYWTYSASGGSLILP